uniref:NB-ARC domain-containing protein n=1 Tax=Salix viminalis TaxID=40686 RepID=A0A6N2KIQ1_SALVM
MTWKGVFRILRFSYSHLKDSALQQCFLYCALFPPDFMIPRKNLVRYLIDEGIIKGFNSRVAEFDKGYSMLNRLENVCLLESAKRLRFIADSFFKQLLGLKVLDLSYSDIADLADSVSDLVSLNALLLEGRMLEEVGTLECHFESHSDFVEYLKCRNENQPLSTYRFFVGLQDEDDYNSKWHCRDKSLWFGNLSIKQDGDFQVMSPNGIQQVLCRCIDATSLSDVLSLNYETDLEVINIKECNTMESLVSSSWFSSAPLPFPSLMNLIAKRLDLDPSNKDNDRSRAASLSRQLMKKQKRILILDDLWNPFKLDKVDIPFRLKGCKLIMTTLSKKAYYRMNCQHKIKVMPLSDGE